MGSRKAVTFDNIELMLSATETETVAASRQALFSF
jgi:hypothetical protein